MPLQVKFTLDYSTIDTTTISTVRWDFGNGTSIVSFNPPIVTYQYEGNFDVSIIIDGDNANPVVKNNYISVHSPLPATFTAEPTDSTLIYRLVPNEDITDNAAVYNYQWQYYSNDSSLYDTTCIVNELTQGNATDTVTFPYTGLFGISLKISDSYGCSDSTYQEIIISEALDTSQAFEVGNVFAPETQDYFVINPQDDAVILNFQVFSRSGILVYRSEAPIIFWDGRSNSGQDLGTGVYFYILEASQGDSIGYYSTKGFIHLFR